MKTRAHLRFLSGGRRLGRVATLRAAGWLMLVAILMPAILPVGFMPTTDRESGLFVAAMCSGDGIQIIKTEPLTSGKKTSGSNCPFAHANATALAAPAFAAVIVELFFEVVGQQASKDAKRPWNRRTIWPPPTGPPALV